MNREVPRLLSQFDYSQIPTLNVKVMSHDVETIKERIGRRDLFVLT